MAIRIPIAIVLGVIAYLIAMAMTVYDGLLSLMFQPFVGLLLTSGACLALLIVGSPLLLPRVWSRWRRLWFVPFAIALAGVLAMAVSWLPGFRIQVWDPELNLHVESFHPLLALGGWSAMLFGVLFQPHLAVSRDDRWA